MMIGESSGKETASSSARRGFEDETKKLHVVAEYMYRRHPVTRASLLRMRKWVVARTHCIIRQLYSEATTTMYTWRRCGPTSPQLSAICLVYSAHTFFMIGVLFERYTPPIHHGVVIGCP